MTEHNTYPIVVVVVGSALVVLFAGACTILAVGNAVPTELWAAASALSGALVGILIPAPGSSGLPDALTGAKVAAVNTHSAGLASAEQEAEQQAATAAGAPSERTEAAATAARDAVSELRNTDFLTGVGSAATRNDSARKLATAAAAITAANQGVLASTAEVERDGAGQAVGTAQAALDAALAAEQHEEEAVASAALAAEQRAQESATNAALTAEQRAQEAIDGAALADAARSRLSNTQHERERAQKQLAAAQITEARANARHAVLSAAATGSQAAQARAAADGVVAAEASSAQRTWLTSAIDPKAVVLSVVFFVTLLVGILMATQLSGNAVANATEHDLALRNAADTLIALASAAGGALVGLLAPAPKGKTGAA